MTEESERKTYNTSGTIKKYTLSFFEQEDCTITGHNYDPLDKQTILTPNEVVITTKNLKSETHKGENYLLTSLKYTLRVCTINCDVPNLWVKMSLVSGITETPILCSKKGNQFKRGIKGTCYQDFCISKVRLLNLKY